MKPIGRMFFVVLIVLSLTFASCGVARFILGTPEPTASNPAPESNLSKAVRDLTGGTPLETPLLLVSNAASLLYAYFAKRQANGNSAQLANATAAMDAHFKTCHSPATLTAAVMDALQKTKAGG